MFTDKNVIENNVNHCLSNKNFIQISTSIFFFLIVSISNHYNNSHYPIIWEAVKKGIIFFKNKTIYNHFTLRKHKKSDPDKQNLKTTRSKIFFNR